MKKEDYVKVIAVTGDYRYGYIRETRDRGSILVIDLFDEGTSKIAWDNARGEILGIPSLDYVSLLTEAEKKVIPLLAMGLTNKEIAEHLSTSPVTVSSQLRTLRLKLQIETRPQLEAMSISINQKLNGQGSQNENGRG